MKTLVLGSAGQLGRDLVPRLTGEVVSPTRADADLTRPDTLKAMLDQHRPDVVVNCAAYNFVDKAESEPEAAFRVNAWGVRDLAMLCGERDVLLVHFSTDYVFGLDLTCSSPFREDASPGPVSVYGLSKLTGEYVVRALAPRHLVIRTCGLYGVWGSGGKGGNFVETMLRVAGQGKPLRVVADQTCTPSYTADVASTSAALIDKQTTGLFHVTNSGSCTWHDLAKTVFELAGVKADLTPIGSVEFGAAARRPGYSVLAMPALERAGIAAVRPWREALAAYLEERKHKR